MYRPMAKFVLLLLLGPPVAALLFAVGACGAGYEQRQEEDPKPRPLPEVRQALRPGEYSSEEFEPSLSFRVGEGWSTTSSPPETSDELALSWEASGGLVFTKIREVYEPTTGTPNVVDAPEDPVLWFERHRYLQTDESRPATVGGADGVRLDVAVEDLPEDHRGGCGPDCVATFRTTGGSALGIPEGGLQRVIVLEDVEGETVIVVFGTRATRFDEFAPEAQKVLDTVEWTGE
jgi:hypothetical protein